MQTSLLTYPRADRYIRIHTSMLVACKGNQCAAACISFFEYWHNYRIQQIEYTAALNEMIEEVEQGSIIDTTGWQYHKNEQLERGVMLWKIDTIYKALDLLESIEFISTDVPDRLVMLHKTGRTKWFLLMVDRINGWLREYEAKAEKRLTPIRIPRQKRETRSKDIDEDRVDQIATVFEYRAKAREAYWTKKNLPYVKTKLTPKIEGYISDALDKWEVWEVCLAIKGNLSSDWHQGKNDRKKVYDEVKLVLNKDKIEGFISRAYTAGFTRAQIEKELSGEADKAIINYDSARHGYNVLIGDLAAKIILSVPDAFDMLITKLLPLYVAETINVDQFIEHAGSLIEAELGMFTEEHTNLLKAITKELWQLNRSLNSTENTT